MKIKENKEQYLSIEDIAGSVSCNEESADLYFTQEGIDIDSYVKKGLSRIDELLKKNDEKKSASKTKLSNKSKLYFKRTVLAAEIASQLHNEPTFGHVKFQKLVYLAEQISKLKADENYSKQAAGPYDSRFMHTIDEKFKSLKWFDVKIEKEGDFSKYSYNPLEDLEKYKKYYDKYFSDFRKQIQWLIDTFKKQKTDKVELIATLFFCWKEINESQDIFSDELLIERFYKWSKEKGKFSRDRVKKAIEWMREKEFLPIQ